MDQSNSKQQAPNSLQKSWARIGGRIVRMALLVYLLFCLLLMAMESRLIYLPPSPRDSQEEARRSGGEEVWFPAEDQTTLHGWFFSNPGSTRALVYYHGNGEDADQNIQLGSHLRDCLHASILVFDYRGYGHSKGTPFEKGIISDGIAAQNWVAEKMHLHPNEVILYGRSLGGGVAVAAAEQLGAKALILHSTFANMDDIAASQYPFVPVRFLMRNPFRSAERIKHYAGPVLQFHGTADELIPIELSRPLFAAVRNENKKFIELPNGHHNDPLSEDFCEVVDAFLVGVESADSAK